MKFISLASSETPGIPRREAIQKVAITTAGVAGLLQAQSNLKAAEASGSFSLPPLSYALDALEPYIDAQTMGIHHGKHHAAYVTNLNKALASAPALVSAPIETILKQLATAPEAVRAAIRNNGGGHANHALFWKILKKNNGAKPSAELAAALDKSFGSFTKFQEKLTDAALKQFGSGWAWLTLSAQKELAVESTPNQDSPISSGRTPLLGIDVWEHAYYLKYQNRRADYITAFFNVIDWDAVTDRYQIALKS